MSKGNQGFLKKKMTDNPFPNEQVDPKVKETTDYGKKIARAIIYRNNFFSSSNNGVSKIQENRQYSIGRQDVNKYKPRMDSYFDSQNGNSLINIDWSIEPVATKIVNQIIGSMINQDHKIQLNSIDAQAKTEYSKKRDEFYGNIMKERELSVLEQMAGTKLFESMENAPQTPEEIDIYMDMEYRQPIEIAFEEIVDFELYRNDWDTIKTQVIRDIVENSKGIVRRYWDANNDIKLRWVDIERYITSATDDPKHKDVEYQAEIHEMTIRDIRFEANGSLTEEQLFDMANNAAGKYQNNDWIFGNSYNSSGTYNNIDYAYDDYRIQILDFVFYTTDVKVYEKKEKKNGGFYMNKKSVDYTPPERSRTKKERVDHEMRMAYSGLWAIDSDVMINYGRERNIVRPEDGAGKKELDPRLVNNFIVIEPNIRNGESTSIIDVMKSTLDEMQLLTLKMRHVLAEAAPPGVAIDISSLNNLKYGTKDMHPKEVLAMWKQKGTLIYDGEDDNGMPMNRKPVEEMLNGVQGALVPLVNQWLFKLESIRTITGMNDAIDGSSPDKDALVGIQKMRVLASNNATREIYQAYLKGILQPLGEALVPMIKTKIQFLDGVEEYKNVIGREGVRAIELTPERVKISRLGIKVEALPNHEDLERLDGYINRSIDQQEIRLEDAIEIRRTLNPKKAERYLAHKKKMYRKEKLEEVQAKEQMTMQREAQASMAAAEAEKVKQAAAAEKEITVLSAKYEMEKELQILKTDNKLKEIDREGYWKERLIEEAESAGDTGIDANNDGKGGGSNNPSLGGGAGVPRPISKPRVFLHPVDAAKRTD
jgi:hypothetical protein